MNPEQIYWSQEKLQQFQEQLNGFWAQDEWNFAQCPLGNKSTHLGKLRFDSLFSAPLKTELKYACWQKFQRSEWSVSSSAWLSKSLKVLVAWLNTSAPGVSSLLDRSIEQWVLSLRSYLLEHQLLRATSIPYLDHQQQIRQYARADSHLSLFRQLYAVLQASYDDREEYDKDIWDLRHLGRVADLSRSQYKLKFTGLAPAWLHQAAKAYLRYGLSLYAIGSCFHKLSSLRLFSQFLSQAAPLILASDIDRPLLLEYLSYLTSRSFSEGTRHHHLVNLRHFLELSAREKWANLPKNRLSTRKTFLARTFPSLVFSHRKCWINYKNTLMRCPLPSSVWFSLFRNVACASMNSVPCRSIV